MSLSDDLAKLQRQRSEEVRTLHCTYLRTKREIRRAASPARIIRKNMGVSLAAAAALGLMLAPRPAPREASEKGEGKRRGNRRGGVSVGWMKKTIGRFFPQAAEFIPDDAAEAHGNGHAEEAKNGAGAAEEPPAKSKHNGILWRLAEMLAPLLMSKIDWRAMINQVMHEVHKKMQANGKNGNGHAEEPHVSVADAGTVKPHDYENFQ